MLEKKRRNNPETVTTLGAQNAGRRQTKHQSTIQ
jgi:hypothetical protein